MKAVNLNTDTEILYCPVCQKYKLIKKGIYKMKVTVNDEAKSCQNAVSMYSYFVVICDDCKTDILKPKKKRKMETTEGK